MPALDNPVPPGLYRLHTGGLYAVLGTARTWSSAGNRVVVYERFHTRYVPASVERELLYMPEPRFIESVPWPDGTAGPRFSLLTRDLSIGALLDCIRLRVIRQEELL
jgi:hypothetical protein